MATRRMSLSGTGKEILDKLTEALETDRPTAIKIALAKGISKASGRVNEDLKDHLPKWTIPDHLIKEREFLLFRQLIVNEAQSGLDEDLLHQYMLEYIEFGLRMIKKQLEEQTSMEDFRLLILQ
ncbi:MULTISPECIES: hypothetical protein [Brevibacillus]|uniref:hypothetical protein n=1 Tax=Brevibacillus TaxID=55080 RepID=UPI000ED9C677|nr:hypothetical protein [Brevibacillus sp.]HBZ83224.1 hypothetical protein [Brevibacillus sp.]